METVDPSTGRPLPADAIQRVLFIAPSVHVYSIPPLTSTKGHVAANWTADPARQIFKARLRILETAVPVLAPATSTPGGGASASASGAAQDEKVKTDILLEEPATGQLFAAAPYTAVTVVEQVLDSSRFFAVTVQGEGGRRAVLGVGFEERSEAFDFSVALQEVRKTLGILSVSERKNTGRAAKDREKAEEEEKKRDFSLKEGQTITVNIGGRKKAGRRDPDAGQGGFALGPSPGGGLLPPPPSAQEVKAQKRLSQTFSQPPPPPDSIEDLGFDDGEFGEFQ